MATVRINGKEMQVEDGTLILDAARDAGFHIPTFCYQADLVGIGSCRMCLVEIEGQRKLQPSCVTPVMDGMSIQTESSTVENARASMLEFLLANHALDCPVCDKGGECELQDMVYRYGPRSGRHTEQKHRFHEKDYILSPVIVKNSNRCVQCMKCVRVCKEVVGRGVLGALGRGEEQEETSFFRGTLDCDQCGNCIEVCPVGCFMRLPYRYKARPWDLNGADSICPYCATGCRLVVEERHGEVVRAKAQLGVGLNSETLCARGRFGYDFINDSKRITRPLIKKFGKLEEATWEETFDFLKEKLSRISGERIGGIASPRLTNEELYIFQKLMRVALGSPNVDSSDRWAPEAVEAFIAATGMTGGGVSVFDVMESDTVIVIGTHLSDENPIIDYIVRRISATRGTNVVVASPRAMKLDSSANFTFRYAPGREKDVLGAFALALAEAEPGLSGDQGIAGIKGQGLDTLLAGAGLERAGVEKLARGLKASKSVGVIVGSEFLRFPSGSANLQVFTGLLGGAGKKVLALPVLDRSNQRGAWEMGVHPGLEPGYAKARRRGMGTAGMLEAAATGKLDALFVAGEDLIPAHNDQRFVKEAFTRVGFLVVQDIFMTETASMADCVLPGATFAEKEGTFTNQEGRVQLLRRLMPPAGKAKSDLDIFGSVGRLFSREFEHVSRSSAPVFVEIRDVVGMYSDVNLEFNNRKNTHDKLDNREALIKGADNALGATTSFSAPESTAGAEGEFTLITGNHLFHSGFFSRKSGILSGLLKQAVVELSEGDASRLGIAPGERVKVANGRFEAVVNLTVKKGSRPGVAFIAENYPDVPVHRFFEKGSHLARVRITRA